MPISLLVGQRHITNRSAQNGAQNIVTKDPGRAKQKSLAAAGANFTKPGAE